MTNAPAITILSSRALAEHVGWMPIFEFEDIFARTTGARIYAPRAKRALPRGLRGIRRRIFGGHELAEQPAGGELLLVVALTPGDLEIVRAVRDLRSKFTKVAGFVVDSFALGLFTEAASLYDHLFVPIPESVAPIHAAWKVPVSYVPFGADCQSWSQPAGARSIDVVSIGRCPSAVREAFRNEFHQPGVPEIFLHSPIGTTRGPEIYPERAMLMKLLLRSKISLAYSVTIDPAPGRPISMPIVLPRYFEALAAGCVIAGKAPQTPAARELFPWEDALIELPDEPAAAAAQVREMLRDGERLAEIAQRNMNETRQRHDWRMRVRTILSTLGVAMPEEVPAIVPRETLQAWRRELSSLTHSEQR